MGKICSSYTEQLSPSLHVCFGWEVDGYVVSFANYWNTGVKISFVINKTEMIYMPTQKIFRLMLIQQKGFSYILPKTFVDRACPGN